MEVLAMLSSQFPRLSEKFGQCNEFHEKKLWHQLTVVLMELIVAPEFATGDSLVHLYNGFVRDFEMKINPLKLAQIVVEVSRRYEDTVAGQKVLEHVADKIQKAGGEPEAHLVLRCEIAACTLRRAAAVPAVAVEATRECKNLLEECKTQLDGMPFADLAVQSAYYRVYAEYLKATNQPNDFYRNALLYLAYTPLETMSLVDQQRVAFDIGLSALLGDKIYNFGELLGHPAVTTLEGTPAEWLLLLLRAFNRGDLAEYERLVVAYQAQLTQIPPLVSSAPLLKQKIQLMSLLEMVFNLSAAERTLSFESVAERTKTPSSEVEMLVMKALALGLIKGIIDQVSETVNVTWVQPRVLDRAQIAQMAEKLSQWTGRVRETLLFLEKGAEEIVE